MKISAVRSLADICFLHVLHGIYVVSARVLCERVKSYKSLYLITVRPSGFSIVVYFAARGDWRFA